MAARKPAAAPVTAFVLHSWDWSETSLIVELYTRERGRLVVAAKGAKRAYSQLRPVLLPFQRLLVQLGRTPADEAAGLHLLRSAEWTGGTTMPVGQALFAGFYANELVMKLTAREDPQVALFDAYARVLAMLSVQPDDGQVQLALRAFELRLLRELGVLPELGAVTLTLAPVQPREGYTLHPESGVSSAPISDSSLSGAQLVQIEAALLHGGLDALCDAVRPAVTRLRGVLRQLLQYHLGTPVLRTRQVMADVQKFTDPGNLR